MDWVAKVRRALSPVPAGRFFVHGGHDADKIPDGAVPLRIEAAMAFGTGHHGTTLGCLLAFDRLLTAGGRFQRTLDLGCGTAVLAMAAARVGQDPVWASDSDAVAIEVARANIAVNGLSGRVECVAAAGFDHPTLRAAAPFDLIFANILKAPLIALAPDMAQHTAHGGVVILSGLLIPQAEEVTTCYRGAGFTLTHEAHHGEWATLTLTRT